MQLSTPAARSRIILGVRNQVPFPKQPVLDLASLRRRNAELPSLLDVSNRVLTHSGRSAIVLALRLLGIGPADRVLVPTYHCPTMVAPIEHVGAIPAFYPLTSSGVPNLEQIKRRPLGDVRALLVPHLFGLPTPLGEIAEFCRAHGIALIEDCAHCFFGSVGGVPVGTTGDFAIGSLPKFFPVVQGGLLVSTTRSMPTDLLASRSIKHELQSGWDIVDATARCHRLGLAGALVRGLSTLKHIADGDRSTSDDPPQEPPFASIRTRSMADVMLPPAALSRIESIVVSRTDLAAIVRRRAENYAAITAALSGLENARPLFPACGSGSVPYVVALLVDDPDLPYARMRAAGLPVFRWDQLWPETPLDPQDAASIWSRGVIQIACHQSLRAQDIAMLCRTMRNCVSR